MTNSQPEQLALFPLDVVLVPGLVLPLHIFEPRYRQLLRDVIATPEPEFGVVAHTGSIERSGAARWFQIGTSARVSEVDALPDGRSDITTIGHRRFRVMSIVHDAPYLLADVQWLDEDTESANSDDECRKLALRASALFTRYRGLLSDAEQDDGIDDLPDDPHLLSYVLTAAPVLTVTTRQRLLECETTSMRLTAACEVLGNEIDLLRVLPSVPLTAQQHTAAELN
ncbi:MAG: peptidase S16 [Actinobacteria bacterium]|nr:peptidase S16 [Actinomycetota bacterium]